MVRVAVDDEDEDREPGEGISESTSPIGIVHRRRAFAAEAKLIWGLCVARDAITYFLAS